ncbi:MAG: hypothetical protein JSS09_00505 [Verrucomicrobia bacterium]|nr:hypothetical protein [Verrucomicrobiota bacterium]
MIRECGAKAKTKGGSPCRRIACKNGKCHLHGGATPKHNPGPKTEEGRLRQKMGSWKHGRRSKEAKNAAKTLKSLLKECKEIISLLC